ncbi:hypothetical protein H4W79_004802 [Nocardiopsis terrae]|uniref:Uncharacterized protein n=1 Tax=Nocardiopsis terrae TaxID=372655 RepID=A0ABR9HNP9_9ACTN|nr:hypothetical protein [Nocardiopsis terrae]MBE1460588.1 hypothetical protein [Nocardiopsis terrae]
MITETRKRWPMILYGSLTVVGVALVPLIWVMQERFSWLACLGTVGCAVSFITEVKQGRRSTSEARTRQAAPPSDEQPAP